MPGVGAAETCVFGIPPRGGGSGVVQGTEAAARSWQNAFRGRWQEEQGQPLWVAGVGARGEAAHPEH